MKWSWASAAVGFETAEFSTLFEYRWSQGLETARAAYERLLLKREW